jgi:hypothetical protein
MARHTDGLPEVHGHAAASVHAQAVGADPVRRAVELIVQAIMIVLIVLCMLGAFSGRGQK